MANSGYNFVRWEGGIFEDSYSSDTSVKFNRDTEITAVFEKISETPPNNGNQLNEFTLEVIPSDKNHGITNPYGSNVYPKGK